MVVGVKDATSQFDQFAVVTQQQQILHTGFRSSHQHRSKPVAHLQQWRQPRPPRQVQTVFTDHQRHRPAEARIGHQSPKLTKHLLQLLRCRALLHLRLGSD